MKKSVMICMIGCLFIISLNAHAGPPQEYSKILIIYPKDKYIIGIGEVNKSGNLLRDKRVAEVLARVEIAKQIKVSLKEETIDIACEGTTGKIFGGRLECRNEFVMVIEETVDEVLVGSSIADSGERNDLVFAIGVLSRNETGSDLEANVKRAVDKSRENIDKARKGDQESLKKAQEEYMRAVTYDKEKEIIEGVRSRASKAFQELEQELLKLKTAN